MKVEEASATAPEVGPWRSKTLQKLRGAHVQDADLARELSRTSSNTDANKTLTDRPPAPHPNTAEIENTRTQSDPVDIFSPDNYIRDDGNARKVLDVGQRDHVVNKAGPSLAAQQDTFVMQAEEHRLKTTLKARANDSSRNNNQLQHTNVFITDLPAQAGDEDLYALGSACGTVISHKAMLDTKTGACKGFGFLMYATHEEAQHAIQWLSNHGFTSSFAQESFSAKLRRMEDSTSTNVYLSNLPVLYTSRQLEQLFAPYPIASLKILLDDNGQSRGVGFVRLHDRTTAQRCIQRLHGRVLPGTSQPLQVRFADSEAQRSLKREADQKQTMDFLRKTAAHDNTLPPQHFSPSLPNAYPQAFAQPQSVEFGLWPQPLMTPEPMSRQSSFEGYRPFAPLLPRDFRMDHHNNTGYYCPPMPLSVPDMDWRMQEMQRRNMFVDKVMYSRDMYPMDLQASQTYNSQKHHPSMWSMMPVQPNAREFSPNLPASSVFDKWQLAVRQISHGMWTPTHMDAQIRARQPQQRHVSAESSAGVAMPRHGKSAQPEAGLRSVSDPLAARSARQHLFSDLLDRRRAAVSADNSLDEPLFRGPIDQDCDDDSSSSIEFQL